MKKVDGDCVHSAVSQHCIAQIRTLGVMWCGVATLNDAFIASVQVVYENEKEISKKCC
jgi:hypothetical protein